MRMLIDATLWSPAEPTAANITTDRKGHTMRFTTLLLVGLVMLGGASCASAPSAQPSADVSGTWQGTWVYSQQSTLGSGQITMTLSQTGSKATGSMVVTGAPTVDRSGPVTMLVNGNDVHLVYPTGITGYLTVSGDDMKGQIDGINPANVVLKRQR